MDATQRKRVKVAYFVSESIDEEELKLYRNVVGFVNEPRNIKNFLKKIKDLVG